MRQMKNNSIIITNLIFSPPTEFKSLPAMVSPKLNIKDGDEEAAWPALNKFTPSSIKRTASAMMKEWEKSLTASLQQDESLYLTPELPQLTKKTMDEESRLLLNNLP